MHICSIFIKRLQRPMCKRFNSSQQKQKITTQINNNPLNICYGMQHFTGVTTLLLFTILLLLRFTTLIRVRACVLHVNKQERTSETCYTLHNFHIFLTINVCSFINYYYYFACINL